MSRWKAASLHLALSIVVIGAIGAALIAVWYGWDLFALMGGLRLLTILAICDIVIGPLLTLIVFKSGKPSLKFDLTVIALLQAAFLAYGLNVMAASRPVFLVAVQDRFEMVFANELDDADLEKAPAEFRRRSWAGPITVGGRMATDSKEALDLALSGFAGKDVHLLPERYVDYATVAPDVALAGKPVSELSQMSPPAAQRVLADALAATGRDEHSVVFLPIISKRGRATMLVEAGTGAILRRVAVDPWPDLAEVATPSVTN